MAKQKLLLVADTYYPKVDGILRFTEEFLKRASSDFDISLLVPEFEQKKRPEKTHFIVPSKYLSLSGYPNMKLSFRNLRTIKESIKEADIIFIQGPALISYLSMYYGKKYQKKVVSYMHVIPWELFEKFVPLFTNKVLFHLIKKLAISFYNRCDEILVPYRDLSLELQKAGIRTKITVAGLGVDINLFSVPANKVLAKKKIGLDPHVKVIGYVGRISKEKNTEVLLSAFKKLDHQSHLYLLLVGDGTPEQTAKFKELDNCRMTGFVTNVQDYLQAMDIFVMPSLTETTSLASLEAMSTGLPIISTKVGFIKNYIVKDYNGVFFSKNNSTMLSIKIQKLLDNKELAQRFGANARKTVAYSFSWERSINKIRRILGGYASSWQSGEES
ncbi:MAG TPA: glycosyltransferase [Candidatus Nanoarchaeia archaeon]|nr:glycosyltransferase [Candidatus Nanoarchaeia archaeon]